MKLSGELQVAEAGASLLREEVLEIRQTVLWREEELDSKKQINTETEVRLQRRSLSGTC